MNYYETKASHRWYNTYAGVVLSGVVEGVGDKGM